MKKIVLLFMSAMVLSLAVSCNKDNDKLVGGEDVADPRLNPGGILMDNGINIVGAWATPFGTNPTNVAQFFLLDSQGNVIHYWNLDEDEYLTMDSNGIIQGSFSDFEEGKFTEYRKVPVFSMLELVCFMLEYDHDIYHYCPWDDGPILTNYSYDDYLRDSKHKKIIDEKQGKVVCSWIDSNNYNYTREIVVKAKDIDNFIFDIKEDTYYGQNSETIFFHRIKGFAK